MQRLGYARVSTSEQADSLQGQVQRLEAAGCQLICTDVESGLEDDRDGLLEALALIKAGGWDELVLTRTDRLGRNASYADMLIALCESNAVKIVSLDGGIIETATPQGFLMARLQTSLAEMESRMLSMRIKKSLSVYRQQKRHMRGTKTPYGYCKGDGHTLAPHPENWDKALKILNKLREHKAFTSVATDLTKWCDWTPTSSNLQYWFVNPAIRGHLCYNIDRSGGKGWNQRWGTIHYDQHPALISEADWRELAILLKQTKNNFAGPNRNDQPKHALTGLLRCHNCNHRLRRSSTHHLVYWRCFHRLCDHRGGIKESAALDFVIQACIQEAERLARAYASPPSIDPRIASKLQDLEAMKQLAARNPSLTSAIKVLEDEIKQLERRTGVLEGFERVQPCLEDPHYFDCLTPDQQRTVFSHILQSVVVAKGGLIVSFQGRIA